MTSQVSIIVPVFNSAPYLRRCIESILGQDFQGTKEIILVDDGSMDGSGAICDEYAASTDCIAVFHVENGGASLARRFGLEKATGEYVSFIDSDDYVSPDYISSLYSLEERFGIGISACRVEYSTAAGESGSQGDSTTVVLEGDGLFHRFFKYEFWGLPGKLYRRSLLLGIPFPQATLSEDYNVMVRLLHASGRMAYFDAPLYHYEKHQGSLSMQVISERCFEEFANVKDVYAFVSSEMPRYEDYALSNVTETAVKLLLASRGQAALYRQGRQELKAFIAAHRKDILRCKPLNRKTAFLALMLA